MKKSSKTWVVLAVVVVLIGLVVVLLRTGLFGQSSLGGYTVLGVSQASVVNDGVLGKSWLISVSTLPNAFTITGRIPAVDVASRSGSVPVSDFDILLGVSQELTYPITDSGEFVYDYALVSSSKYFCLLATPTSSGEPSAYFLKTYVKYGGALQCQTFWIQRIGHGKVGVVQASPAIPSTVRIRVTGNGLQSEEAVISTDLSSGSGSVPLMVNGQRLGRVDYAGDLGLNAQPKPELFQLYKPINKDGVWFFASMSAYNAYNGLNKGDVYTNLASCLTTKENTDGYGSGTAQSYFQQCVDTYHNAFVGLQKVSVANLKEISVDGKSQILARFDAGSRLYVVPTLSFLIDTDWVGIKVNAGVPLVTKALSSEGASGQHGKVYASVKNTGSGMGAFDVVLQCPAGVSVLTTGLTDNFQPSEEKAFVFEFDMNVAERTTKTCAVKATDKASFKSSSKNVDVTINPAVICIAGQEYCQGGAKVKCNSDGSAFSVVSGDTSCLKKPNETVSNESICAPKLAGIVTGGLGVKESCNFWCTIGLKKAEPVNVCVYDWTPIIIMVGGFVVVLFLILIFRKKKGKKKGSFELKDLWGKHKWKTIATAILIVVVLSLAFPTTFFRTLFWITAGIAVLLFGILVYKKVKR